MQQHRVGHAGRPRNTDLALNWFGSLSSARNNEGGAGWCSPPPHLCGAILPASSSFQMLQVTTMRKCVHTAYRYFTTALSWGRVQYTLKLIWSLLETPVLSWDEQTRIEMHLFTLWQNNEPRYIHLRHQLWTPNNLYLFRNSLMGNYKGVLKNAIMQKIIWFSKCNTQK